MQTSIDTESVSRILGAPNSKEKIVNEINSEDGIEILHRFTKAVLFKAAVTTVANALALAVGQEQDLSGANLIRANLSGADLSGANLSGANLIRANLPSPTIVLLASWGEVSKDLCRDLMTYDAACHPDPTAFSKWASRTAGCPYSGIKVQRAAQFCERREYWSENAPLCRPYELMTRVLAEKCPVWTEAQQTEFTKQFAKSEQ